MSELDIITAVVVSHLTSGVGDLVAAPLKGVAQDLQERVRSSMARIGDNAREKAGDRPLEASDRVLYKVLTEGAFSDDEIIVDYLGGILAASTADDAGAAVVAQIGRLSSLHLRVHYVIYREVRRLWPEDELNLYEATQARRATIAFTTELLDAVGTTDHDALGSAIAVLHREELVYGLTLRHGEDDYVTTSPTGLGAELFMWGNGVRPVNATRLVDKDLHFSFETAIPPTPHSRLIDPRDPDRPPGSNLA